MARDKEPFFSRWSRRKLGTARAPEPAPAAKPAAAAPPELPPVDQLSFDSDYRGFLHPKVDEALRRRALKKLFSSGPFHQPDMMDDYNEDYTLLETLAPGDRDALAHAKRALRIDEPAPQAEQAAPEAQAAAPEQTAQTDTPPQDPPKTDGAAG